MLKVYLTEFIALASVHFLAVVTPGPDFAITVSQSVRFGRKVGTYTALGIGSGISIHVLYTILGIGTLISTAPWLMTVAKIIGTIYVLYLAFQLLRAKPPLVENVSLVKNKEYKSPQQAFSVGFLTNATNPKATLFFLAIFTTMVSDTTPLPIQVLYGLWMCCVNAAWFVLISVLFSRSKVRKAFLRLGYWFERFLGLVLIFFAFRLLFTL